SVVEELLELLLGSIASSIALATTSTSAPVATVAATLDANAVGISSTLRGKHFSCWIYKALLEVLQLPVDSWPKAVDSHFLAVDRHQSVMNWSFSQLEESAGTL
ncbi:hypothetical protein Taro_039471, partial [Colocasia esculenta]|nr:hypothetical protein [Colocasia esculenta]